MPSSNPLPPKENALFKRILVSIFNRIKVIVLTVLIAQGTTNLKKFFSF